MVFRFLHGKDKLRQALAKTRNGWSSTFARLTGKHSLGDEALWEQLEEALIAADIGVGTSINLIETVREKVRKESAVDGEEVLKFFKEEMLGSLDIRVEDIGDWRGGANLTANPFVLLMVGVNGSGKTTSIAKLAYYYKLMGKTVLMAAGDTFRAGAIDQLKIWGDRLGIDVVAHQQGADPGAVVYDAYVAAKARGMDILIVDTAGRLHTNQPLIDELRKVRRILERLEPSAPQQTILVLDGTTGQNGFAQAKVFQESIGVTGIFLAKLDGSAKGGIVVAIAQHLGLPILFVGTGESVEDLSLFDADDFVNALFSEEIQS